jgi:thiosulfate/3-mercaptopyruvate sulfurtransferase
MVVVYDHDGNLQAGRAWWVLRWLGVDTRLLDGGFAAWQRAGLPVVHAPPATPEAGDVAVRPGGLGILDAEAAAGLARTGVLLDSRMHANYLGAPTLPGERGRGHIPGALSLPAADNLDAAGCFADSARLRARYASLGADGSRSIGVYCGAGVSAAHNVAALAILGLSASMYPGSWSAWSADLGLPVAIGPEPG